MTNLRCISCKNFDAETSKCLAFPLGIPQEILDGSNDHSKPLPEQLNDIVFEEV